MGIGFATTFRSPSVFLLVALTLPVSLLPGSAFATWSIIIVDTQSHEVAVGSATCLTGFDLEAGLPVVIVDLGAAAAQSLVDVSAVNRIRIHEQLLLGTRPPDILFLLSMLDSSHQQRQYGIVTVRGDALTFTGLGAGAYAGGVTGEEGSLVYTIQGNVLTGAPVIEQAELAIGNTSGGLAEKLMAAMEAARAMGGDGRCSCFPNNPTGCGSPPLFPFQKSAHVGFMIVSRPGDTNGVCDADLGCANGDYYLNLNVPNQTLLDPDPVFQLREQFDDWRASLVGKPDAVRSTAYILPGSLLAGGGGAATMTVNILDWQGNPVADDSLAVAVTHAPGSDETTTIGEVEQIAANVFQVALTGGAEVGVDVFDVRVTGAFRPVTVIPRPRLVSAAVMDLGRDGDVDLWDFEAIRQCMAGPGVMIDPGPGNSCLAAALASGSIIDMRDVSRLQREFTGGRCMELQYLQHPQSVNASRCGSMVTLSVAVEADPPAMIQWFRNNAPIARATEPSYFIPALTNKDLGVYHVEAANTCGTVISRSADLTTSRPCP